MATACANPKTKICSDATKRVDDLQGKLVTARKQLATTPVVAGEGDAARISAWTGGYLSEHQVRLYLPLLWPVTMALLGAFFWGAWGDHRPPEPKPLEAGMPVVEPAPQPAPQRQSVVGILTQIIAPAARRSKVDIAEIFAACKARGADLDSFGAQAKAFTEAANIRVLSSEGKLYWCGVQLVA
jgi:hypothetical protein